MMKATTDGQHLFRMENIIARLLRYGAIVASVWLTIGLALGMLADASPFLRSYVRLSEECLTIGIVLLIALPVLRVALTTAVFLFEKDYLFAAISGAVLLIIALGFLLGVMSPNGGLL